MIKAEIVADSSSVSRITTFLLTYPRFIHSELMTHRMFSRNAASSRAIPVERMTKEVSDNPAMPVEWGTIQKGMQAGPVLEGQNRYRAETIWCEGRDDAIHTAEKLLNLGIHKQVANRVLEPWMHMTTLVTATEYGNFFKLRAHPAAQPEFQELAYEMLSLYLKNKPVEMEDGEWHLPFISNEERREHAVQVQRKICTARCARTSYVKMTSRKEVAEDIEFHDRLLVNGHMSPFEHAARANPYTQSANFWGWTQYREIVEQPIQPLRPSRKELEEILAARPKR